MAKTQETHGTGDGGPGGGFFPVNVQLNESQMQGAKRDARQDTAGVDDLAIIQENESTKEWRQSRGLSG